MIRPFRFLTGAGGIRPIWAFSYAFGLVAAASCGSSQEGDDEDQNGGTSGVGEGGVADPGGDGGTAGAAARGGSGGDAGGGLGGDAGSAPRGGSGGDTGAAGEAGASGASGGDGPGGTCGDGTLDDDEECDDGGVVTGDGCGPACIIEAGWSCDRASPSRCTRPSCVGLDATCGSDEDGDCCAAGLVPGGTFNRSNDADFPATVSRFNLDIYTVTVGRFRNFVAAYSDGWRPSPGQGRNPNDATDSGWSASWDARLPADIVPALTCNGDASWTDAAGANENQPMVCASFEEAFAFCVWDGGRLPSETEFNFASAGGSEQRQYPWSNPPSSAVIDTTYASYDCTGDGSAVGDCSTGDLLPVGSKPNGNARWGHADLAGNVWEWTRDWSADYVVPCVDCANTTNGDWHILRGGGYGYDASYLVTSFRFGLFPGYTRTGDIGFRCARQP